MHWNRMDICAAYYHYACITKSYGKVCRIMDTLERLSYKPGLSDRNLATTTTNTKEIYMELVRNTPREDFLRI